jgi:hypothetical protein
VGREDKREGRLILDWQGQAGFLEEWQLGLDELTGWTQRSREVCVGKT